MYDPSIMSSQKSPPNVRRYKFDWKFLRRLWSLHPLLFPRFLSQPALLLASLLFVGVSEQVVGYFVGLISGEFYLVLENKDSQGFVDHLIYSLVLIMSMSYLVTTRMYLQKQLIVSWRKSLTSALHKLYFASIKFYQLNALGELIWRES